jgi:hypothetical protein
MRSIGETQKEHKDYTDKLKRPVIGKFGIGLLAVSPICRKFRVISSVEGSPFKFEAEIDLTQFRTTLQRKGDELGTFLLWDRIPEDRDSHFTQIILEDLDPYFRKSLKEPAPEVHPNSQMESFEKSAVRLRKKVTKDSQRMSHFEEFVRWMAKGPEIKGLNLPGRDKLTWELGFLCPLRYLDAGSLIGGKVFTQIKKELISFDFKVFLDGTELCNPALFPLDPEIKEPDVDYAFEEFSYDSKEEPGYRLDIPLRFTGYVYWQRKGIMPPSLRGVLLRVRYVGVDSYDDSCLKFPELQALRLQQVSAEIFIHEGLEEAFNIDRKSFRETDPQYQTLQNYFRDRLMALFRNSYKWGRNRRETKSEIKERDHKEHLISFIKESTGLEIDVQESGKEAPDPIIFDKKRKAAYVNQHPVWPRSQHDRQILEEVLVCLQLARETGSERDWYPKFLDLLEQLHKGSAK